MPEKALHRIFWHCVRNESSNGFLTKAQQLSTAWRDASTDPSLWTHLDLFSLKEKHRNDKKVELLLKKYPQVTELKLNGWKNAVSTSTLKIVASNCPGLTSLGLSGCFKLTNEDMKLIGDSFEKLKRIDLSNVSVRGWKIESRLYFCVHTIFVQKRIMLSFSRAHSHASTKATRRHEYSRGS